MNWFIRPLLVIFLVVISAYNGRLLAQEPGADLSNLVIVGDSISAGHQNSCLLHTQQRNGFASLLAKQAGVDLPLPLVGEPGFPPCLELQSLDPLIVGPPDPPLMPGMRLDLSVEAQNISVPGMRVVDSLDRSVADDDFRKVFFNGYPFKEFQDIVFAPHEPTMSQIDVAVELDPSTIVLWLGSNDVLWAVIGATPIFITPPYYFESSFIAILDRLTATGATIIVGNIPDVSVIPFTRPAESLPPELVPLFPLLGITADDRITLPGLAEIQRILDGDSFPPLSDFFVLTPGEATTIQTAVDNYNAFIRIQVNDLREDGYPIALADINSMLRFAENNGVVLAGRSLSTDYLGGLFTLDGIHPTNTAHAIIANAFINVLNAEFNTGIRPLSVGQINKILHDDPLVFKNVGRPSGAPGGHDDDVLRSLDFIRDPLMSP